MSAGGMLHYLALKQATEAQHSTAQCLHTTANELVDQTALEERCESSRESGTHQCQ